MWDSGKETYLNVCNEISREIKGYKLEVEKNTPTEKELQEALDHHLEQLNKLGATLEDDVCQVLRKAIKVAELNKTIAEKEEVYKRNWDEYQNFTEG